MVISKEEWYEFKISKERRETICVIGERTDKEFIHVEFTKTVELQGGIFCLIKKPNTIRFKVSLNKYYYNYNRKLLLL